MNSIISEILDWFLFITGIAGIIMLCACVNAPSFQGQTTVLGLELETAGTIFSGESPFPKLRFGLIHHQSQLVQRMQSALMYSEKQDLNLWTASGETSDIYSITPCKDGKD